MARRRINFDNLDVPDNTLIENVVSDQAKKIIVTDANGNMRVIKREDFNQNMGNITDVNEIQTDLEDGASISERYLFKDLDLINNHFFKDFDRKPLIDYDDDGWIIIENFPLPDDVMIDGKRYRYPVDSEKIIIVLDNYPEMPPIGFHIKENSPNRAVFEELFKTHKFDRIAIGDNDYMKDVSELGNKGWHWICFHYHNNHWNFNRNNIQEGDALFKYFHWLFAKFSGLDVAG